MMRASGSKSGNPCAKLTAFSGPCSARFRRVISRMTDSVKLCAFSDRPIDDLVPGIGALQLQVGARAREAAHRALQAALPPAAYLAGPARLGEEVEHIRPAEESDHLAASDHRHAAARWSDSSAGRMCSTSSPR